MYVASAKCRHQLTCAEEFGASLACKWYLLMSIVSAAIVRESLSEDALLPSFAGSRPKSVSSRRKSIVRRSAYASPKNS
jgi:hypothetical protein